MRSFCLGIVLLLAMCLPSLAAPPPRILAQFGTTNTPTVLTNIIQSIAGGGALPGAANVLAYGADPTGAFDSTASIQTAYDAIKVSGGTLTFPHGVYRMNLLITNDNIILESDGAGIAETSALIPADATRPVIQVGNDTARVRNIRFKSVTIDGWNGLATGDIGLRLAGGAMEVHAWDLSLVNAHTNLFIMGGTNEPVGPCFFSGFTIRPGGHSPASPDRGIYFSVPPYGTKWTSSSFFSDGYIFSPVSTSSFGIEIVGAEIDMTHCYLESTPGQGTNLHLVYPAYTNGNTQIPNIVGKSVYLDSSSSSDTLVYIDDALREPTKYFRGQVSVNGLAHFNPSNVSTQLFNTTYASGFLEADASQFNGNSLFIGDVSAPNVLLGTATVPDSVLGVAPINFGYSGDASQGDTVLKASGGKKLLLQSGPTNSHIAIIPGGFVGIGLKNPVARLHILSGPLDFVNELQMDNPSGQTILSVTTNGAFNFGTNAQMSITAAGKLSAPVLTSSNLFLGDPSGVGAVLAEAPANFDYSDDANRGDTVLRSAPGAFLRIQSGVTNAHITVSTNGYVGIGTNKPQTTLHVNGNSLFVGTVSAQDAGVQSERFGASSVATGPQSTALGNSATASGSSSTAIGVGATASANFAVTVGGTADGYGGTAVGISAVASGSNSIAIGASSFVSGTGTNSAAIGAGVSVTRTNVIQLGTPATDVAIGRDLEVAKGFLIKSNTFPATANFANLAPSSAILWNSNGVHGYWVVTNSAAGTVTTNIAW